MVSKMKPDATVPTLLLQSSQHSRIEYNERNAARTLGLDLPMRLRDNGARLYMRDVESPVQRLNTHMATLGKISMDKGVGTDNAESDFSGKWSNWP